LAFDYEGIVALPKSNYNVEVSIIKIWTLSPQLLKMLWENSKTFWRCLSKEICVYECVYFYICVCVYYYILPQSNLKNSSSMFFNELLWKIIKI